MGGGIRALIRYTILLGILAYLPACGTTATPPRDQTADAASGDAIGVEIAAADTAIASDAKKPGSATVVAKLDPDEGPSGGTQIITITGNNLGQAWQVLFGQSPALDLFVIDDGTLQVTVPPRPAGVVDVTVRSTGRPDATLHDAYRYLAEVGLTGLSPAQGSASGGTAVSVTGSGFVPGTRFVFGDRQALATVIYDEHSAALLTPPGQAGKANVYAINGDGQAKLAHAFWYRAPPVLQQLDPATVPVAGGVQVTLRGQALNGKGLQVKWLQGDMAIGAQVVSTAPDGSALVVAPPSAAEAGMWSVQVSDVDGASTLNDSFFYVDAGVPTGVLGVTPAAQPLNHLQPVTVALAGQFDDKQLGAITVQFGNVPATVLQTHNGPPGAHAGASLWVQPPTRAEPAVVDVAVAVNGIELVKSKAFSYGAAVPVVVAVAPKELSTAGGTPISVQVQAGNGHGSITAVRVGALLASHLQDAVATATGADRAVQVQAPTGSPGPADVVVRFADGTEAVLANACSFADATPAILGVVPGRGAVAGGTLVTLIGSGLGHLKGLQLGGTSVVGWQNPSDGAVTFKTPPGKPGQATLHVLFDSGLEVNLAKAFVYFDPSSGDIGTWGEPIDGALNVTVLKKGQIGVVAGATVVIGSDPKKAIMGITNAKGQVTLSAANLSGPLHVHASKTGWSAGSVIALGVENVTIRLAAVTTASGQAPPNVDQATPLPATVTGTVIDAAKYTQFPLGTCKGQPAVGGNCLPCDTNSDCSGQATCESLRAPLAVSAPGSDGGHYCAAICGDAGDCPADFECRAVGIDLSDAHLRCVPSVGKRETRCEGASPWISGGAPNSPFGTADSDGHFTVVVTPGDVAIICRAGYISKTTGEFVPLSMGLARGLFLVPGDATDGVLVKVNVPLDRSIRVKLDHIPMGSDATGQRYVLAGIDLGSEGYIPLGTTTTYAVTDTLLLTRQPAPSLWNGNNSGLRYEFYGGLSQAYGGPPLSLSQTVGLDPRGLDRYAHLQAGSAAATIGDGEVGALLAAASSGDLRVAVGEQGRIVHWTGGTFTEQPSPSPLTWRAVWLPSDAVGDGWIGGDEGYVARHTNLGWKLWGRVGTRTVVALAGRTQNDAWLVDSASQLFHWNGADWTEVAGPWQPAAAPGKYDPTPPHKQVRAAWHSPSGHLYLAGDEGTLLRATWSPASLPGVATPAAMYETLPAGTGLSLNALAGSSEGDLWVCGDHGYLGHYNGLKLQTMATSTTQNLLAVAVGAPGQPVQVVGGRGTWLQAQVGAVAIDVSPPDLRVDLRGTLPTFDGGWVAVGNPVLVMGPYLEMPLLQLPAPGQSLGGASGSGRVVWTAKPGIDPTLNMLRLADESYQTRWELLVRGNVTVAELPDFALFGVDSPLPTGTAYVRLWRIYNPGLDVDNFTFKGLSSAGWRSWAYMVRSTEEPPWLPSGAPQPTPGTPQPGFDPPWPK